ncbi:MAG: OsmC family protein [Gemmatimonadota bacterium]|nr:OsmC family protein [Gemmatimonadota bacterium]
MTSLRPDNRVQIAWAGDHRFDAGRPGGPQIRIDASAQTGPGPVDALLVGLGCCTGVDVVDILAKRRTPVESLGIEVQGERREEIPRRIIKAHLVYRIDGAGIEREHAERAIDLAVTKYCSVRDSLDPSIPINWSLVLNGI